MSDPLHRKFDGLESMPLFDEPPRKTGGEKSKTRTARVFDIRRCPECDKRVAIQLKRVGRDGKRRLAFKRHHRITNSGASFPCRMSDTEVNE